MRYRVLPYRQGSGSAKALAEALGGRVLKLTGGVFKPRPEDLVINWGFVGSFPRLIETRVLNSPSRIKTASNKLSFFNAMVTAGLADLIPPFWTRQEDIPDDAFPVVCRTVLAGHSGDGIVLSLDRNGLVPASLYVGYVKKKDEYRVHVGKSGEEFEVIALQRKARRLETPDEEVNWQVRNHHNGFVFVRQDVAAPPAVITAAKLALEASGLDFGAVDVIWNDKKERAYVLEINTAPGLEGQTVVDYASFFQSLSG